MANLSQTVAKLARVVEKEVTLPTTSGTIEAISLPAGCVVLAAGVVTTTAIAGSTGYTIDLSVGSADVQSALDIQAATVGTITVDAAVATAQQINKTETYRDPDSFADIVRGMHLYGRKILRPEAIVTAKYNVA